MKKLSSTTWSADASTLKRLYAGRVRPVLEYGMAAWGNTAKTNIDKMSKVQNQAARIITGSMRSTPTQELETITGLQPLFGSLSSEAAHTGCQVRKGQRSSNGKRMNQPTRGRLKKEIFVHQSRCLDQRHRDILEQTPKRFPSALRSLPGAKKDISLSKAAYQE